MIFCPRYFFLLIAAIAIFTLPGFSQTKKVDFTLVLKEGKNNVNDASVVVFTASPEMKKETQLLSAKSAGGKCKLQLELKKYFLIEISRTGFINQQIFFNTSAPEPDIQAGNTNDFVYDADMIRMTDGLDASSITGTPVCKIKYLRDENHFEADDVYAKSIKPKVDKVKGKLAELLKKGYNKEFQDGNNEFGKKNYEEALLHYNRALEFLPDEKDPKKKIAEIEKAGVNNEKAYLKFRGQGDDAFNKKDIAGAQVSYNKALAYKPNDAYIKGKIAEIQNKGATAQNQKQENPVNKNLSVKVKCVVFKEDKKLKDAQAALFEEGVKIKAAVTTDKGEFSFDLGMNKNYSIEISKPGMVTEKISVKTHIPASLKGESSWFLSTSVSMLDMIDGLNTSVLNDPVRTIKYYPDLDDFKSDKDYAAKMDKVVDNLIAQADMIRKNPKLTALNTRQAPANTSALAQNTQDNKQQEQATVPENTITDNSTGEAQQASTEIKNQAFVNTDNRTSAQKIDSCISRIKSLQVSGDKKELAVAYGDIASIYYESGDNSNAIEYYGQCLKNKEETGDRQGSSIALMNLGVIYFNLFRYEDALNNFRQSLKIKQELSDKPGESKLLYRIGNVYYEKQDFEKAAEFFEKSLTLDINLRNDKDIAASYNNLGIMYYELKNYGKAMEYYEKALKMNEASGQEKEKSIALNNMGNINYDWKKFSEALDFYEKSLQIKERIDYKKGVATSLFNIGNVYRELTKYEKALEYYNRSASVSKSQNYGDILYSVYAAMSDVFSLQKDCEKAFEYYKLSVPFKQYALNAGYHRQLSEMQIKYESESMRSGEEISLLKEEVARQKLAAKEIAERNRLQMDLKNTELKEKETELKMQRMQKYALFAGFFLVLLLAFVFIRGFMIQKRQNTIIAKKNTDLELAYHEISEKNEELKQQKEEIIAQRDEIEAQKDIITDQRDIATAQRDQIAMQKQEITDSINYAQYIQRAILVPDEEVISMLPEHFILFRPRNIVSGDFYWLGKKDECLIIAAVDCTGHGVPGGFMSMLGVAFLNEIVNKLQKPVTSSMYSAGDILNQLRENIIKSLHQTGKEGESKDGMDIALCVVNLDKKLLNFAGAFNPMYLIRNGELTEMKADRMPIGIFIKDKTPFTSHEITIQKGDQVYIFSDGFADQFGGPKERKFGHETMKKLLIKNSSSPMKKQAETLLAAHDEWRAGFEQIDDILVIGFKI